VLTGKLVLRLNMPDELDITENGLCPQSAGVKLQTSSI